MSGNKLIQFRVNADQRYRWEAAAEREGVPLLDWLKNLADDAAEGERPKRPVSKPAVSKLLSEGRIARGSDLGSFKGPDFRPSKK